jgi:hypothetical protein
MGDAMSIAFQNSLSQMFTKSVSQQRGLLITNTNFVCVAAYWPFNGFRTFGTPSGGTYTFNNSWPVIYSTMTENWFVPGNTPTNYTRTTVFNNYFWDTPSTLQVSKSITGSPPPNLGSLDLSGISVSSTLTDFYSVGTSGTYSVTLTNLMNYATATSSCLALLATVSMPAFPSFTDSNTTSSPFKKVGNLTIGIAPSSTGAIALTNPAWVGAAANGLPLQRGNANLDHIYDYNYFRDIGYDGGYVIMCGKSNWRINHIVPADAGLWVDPTTGLPAALWSGVNYLHTALWSHLYQTGGFPIASFTDLGTALVKTLNYSSVIGFTPSDVPGYGELGFQSTINFW